MTIWSVTVPNVPVAVEILDLADRTVNSAIGVAAEDGRFRILIRLDSPSKRHAHLPSIHSGQVGPKTARRSTMAGRVGALPENPRDLRFTPACIVVRSIVLWATLGY